jgi:hypothetical protein
MPYYPTLDEDVARAKEILAKGAPCRYRPDHNGECLDCDEPAEVHQLRQVAGGAAIYGADTYAAYKLLESFVEALEAVGPKVAELALRHNARAARPSITCPFCHWTSYHPKDIEERYCGHCHRFRTEDGGAA